MLLLAYIQNLDPLDYRLASTAIASLPVLILFYLLVIRRWLASWAGAAGAVAAILIAWLVYGMPVEMAGMAFVHGAAFGLLPICWTVFCAMLLYNITVETGQFRNVRRSVASLSKDGRVQSVLIGFAFGAFLEGSAGSGAPVAVCGAMLVGLGCPPLTAAVICLIANTSPVAYGGIGTPIVVLDEVTGLGGGRISVMASHQLPILSVIIPVYMVKMMCSWRDTLAIWPALMVVGGSFAGFQYLFGTLHLWGGPEVWPVTDVGAGILSLVSLALFLRFWKPRKIWSFETAPGHEIPDPTKSTVVAALKDPHVSAEADIARSLLAGAGTDDDSRPLRVREVVDAWMPFALMAVFLVLNGFLRIEEKKGVVEVGPIKTVYAVEIPFLHNEVERAERLQKPDRTVPELEKAEFKFIWLSAAGTPVFIAAVLSMGYLRMTRRQIAAVFRRTFVQMKVPIPTIMCMLGLSYVTRYAGMDATLGIAFAETGILYPFFAAMLGWLGVFLTGTDAGSNALFGSLQKITATEVWNAHHTGAMSNLTLDQAQVLICTANSTGGVMGKMIDAQSICVATAGTNQIGREADIFRKVVWHSVILASIVGLMTLLQAFVPPFTRMVP